MADDDADDGRAIVRVIEVWECHQQAVAVFQLCPIDGVGHMGGIYWTGVEPQVAMAAFNLLDIPVAGAFDLVSDVAYMGQCVARERNLLAAEKSRRGR